MREEGPEDSGGIKHPNQLFLAIIPGETPACRPRPSSGEGSTALCLAGVPQ